MKCFKCLVIFMVCMFISPLVSKAECSYERVAELSRIASNVQFSYEYELIDEFPVFIVNVTNVTNDIYLMENIMGKTFVGAGEHSMKYTDDGIKISFVIYSNDHNCKGEKLMTQYVNLPEYNYLITSDECKQNPNFKHCTMWGSASISIDDFNSELQQYQEERDAATLQGRNSWYEKALDVLKAQKVEVVLCFVSIILLIIIVFYRKHRRAI